MPGQPTNTPTNTPEIPATPTNTPEIPATPTNTPAGGTPNAVEDDFTRANQAGWGSATNNDGVPAVTWGVDPVASGKGAPKKNASVASTGGELSQDRKTMTGGRVVYVLSHFGKQESTADEHSLQNLLINFLVEANERRGSAPVPAPR